MLGGRKTAEQSGLKVPNREALYARMKVLPEGSLFQQSDIVQDPSEVDDFHALKGFDYVHVVDGYFTQIIETQHLRRLPSVAILMANYSLLRGCNLVETGDRTAWKNGMKAWEPIEGYRFHTNRTSELLTLGHMKIRIIAGPEWARDISADATLFRCFYDQPLKELRASFLRAHRPAGFSKEDLVAAADFGDSLDAAEIPDDWAAPSETSAQIREFIKSREDR
jgi:hypothetical protein